MQYARRRKRRRRSRRSIVDEWLRKNPGKTEDDFPSALAPRLNNPDFTEYR